MVSRSNRRRCMADGWDGHIPTCEGVKGSHLSVYPEVKVLPFYGGIIKMSDSHPSIYPSSEPNEIPFGFTGLLEGTLQLLDKQGLHPEQVAYLLQGPDFTLTHAHLEAI